MSPQPDLRSGIIDLLELLSSRQRQLEYEQNVPHVSVPKELLCMWFDDIYRPESPTFQHGFAPGELLALADFNSYYRERADLLPESRMGIKVWHTNARWQEVMLKAAETLVAFGK